VAEFELGLEEVGLQPVDGFVVHLAAEQGFGGWAGDALTSGQGCLVLATDLRIGDSGVDHGHCGRLVAEEGHDGLEAGAALGELGAHGVPEPMGAHGRLTLRVDQPGRGADGAEGVVEQGGGGDELAAAHEHVVHEFAGGLVAPGHWVLCLGLRDDFLEGGCGVGVEWDDSFGVALADRDPEPRMSVGVVVEAVDGQAPDLVPPGARPAQQEQRARCSGR